jgi:hypothetical protein
MPPPNGVGICWYWPATPGTKCPGGYSPIPGINPGTRRICSRRCWHAPRRRTRMRRSSPICCHCRRPSHPLPSLSPQRKKQRTLEALIRQLEGLARRQLVVIVFEDAHWIDPTSRELLDLMIESIRKMPVLLIVTFHPEFQPPWTGQEQVSTLALNRLDRHDRAVLIERSRVARPCPMTSSPRSSTAATACRCSSRS